MENRIDPVERLRECKACQLPNAPESFSELEAYMDTSPVYAPEKRVAGEVYLARVAVCLDCPRRDKVTCLECGCYVPLRCALKLHRCPIKKWK